MRSLQKTLFVLMLAILAAALTLPMISLAQAPQVDSPSAEASAQAAEITRAQQRAGASSNVGGGDKTSCSIFSQGFGCAIYWVLDAVTDLVVWLTINPAAALFDGAIAMALQPLSGLLFVQIGFRITVGVANVFFVLILLWIAIATIFDYSPYSARTLLPTLIFAALLVNFSLAIGNAVIALANGVGSIFYTQIRNVDLSRQGIVGVLPSSPIAQKVMALSKFQTLTDTRAQNPITLDEVRIAAERECRSLRGQATGGISCVYAWFDGAWRWFWGSPKQDEAFLEKAFQAVLFKLIFIPILLFVLLAGAILLIVRTVSLAFLLILAPLAFLFMILPATRSYMNEWWRKLIQWSFFFPAFLFFVFLSLRAGAEFTQIFVTTSGGGNQQLPGLIQYLMIAGLLIGSIIVAQKSSLAGANTVVGLGQKAWGATKGWAKGTAKIVGGAAAGAALGTGLGQRVASTPIIRGLAKPLEAAVVAGSKVAEARQKAASTRRATVTRISSAQEATRELRGMSTDDERIDYLEEIRRQDPNRYRTIVQNTPSDILTGIRAEAQQTGRDDVANRLLDSIQDLTRAVEVESGLNRADPNFQPRVNSWLASATPEQIQRVVSADNIRNPATGQMNQNLQASLNSVMDIDAFKALGNNREKAERLRDYFGQNLGGQAAYASAIVAGQSEADALRLGMDRAITNLRAQNSALADQLNASPVIRVNLSRGVPLARRASALNIGNLSQPTPPPTP